MMTDAAKEARRAYKREWARQNRDKVKATRERFWQRVAERLEDGEDISDIVQGASERADGKRAG